MAPAVATAAEATAAAATVPAHDAHQDQPLPPPPLLQLLLGETTTTTTAATSSGSAVAVSVLLLPASPDFMRFQGRLRIEAGAGPSAAAGASSRRQVRACVRSHTPHHPI